MEVDIGATFLSDITRAAGTLNPWLSSVSPSTRTRSAEFPSSVICGCRSAPSVAMVADGMTVEEILSDFPDLEPEDIRAALHFVAD